MILKNCSFSKKLLALSVASLFVLSFAVTAKAQTDSAIANDFVLQPGKVEIFANPGDTITKTITILNRASTAISFKVEVEDFVGSNTADQAVVLLGNEKSPYSIKDNIVPSVKSFTLENNGTINVPVTIHIPKNAQPGGFYASVLVSNEPSATAKSEASGVQGGTKVVSRVGTLFFIRVNGVAKESGSLEDFKVVAPSSENPNYMFDILFKNDGNVHLVPFGYVTVTSLFGKVVGKVPVDAYFALPQSIRYREVAWNAPALFGKYSAKVELNRGYGSNLVDIKTVSFWIIPWATVATIIIIALVIYLVVRSFFKKYKLVAKE